METHSEKPFIPRLRSKFLQRKESNVVSVQVSDSEDSDEETNGGSFFIIDKNPNETTAPKLVKDFEEIKFNSELRPTIDTSGYFKSKSSVESMKQLDKITIEENSSHLKKSAITGIEKTDFYMESKREQKRKKKLEREKTKGEQWFDLPATEMTEEKKRDLMLLQMRNVWDAKHFYKKSDSKEIPKYFQVATVVDSPVDFYSDRVVRKNRKNTLVDELLADAEFKKWSKKKYVEALKNNPFYLRQARKNKKRSDELKAERQQKNGDKTNKGAKKHANRLKRRK